MTYNLLMRLDRLSRTVHLYTGLFLAPWICVYAASAFCLNHGKWITEKFKIKPASWETVSEVKFTPESNFPRLPEEQARAILHHLNLEGAHRIQGKPQPNQMIIFRMSGSGHHRITWHRQRSLIVVEKQKPFSFYRLMHYLHFRGGYNQPYFTYIAWAIIVDLVAISMVVWVISGIYLWARRPRKRILGGLTVIAGSLLFICLAIALCFF